MIPVPGSFFVKISHIVITCLTEGLTEVTAMVALGIPR
jgi:hypothetical protein